MTPPEPHDLPAALQPFAVVLSAVLLGLSWASARADDIGPVLADLPPNAIPQGLDSVTFPAALVALAWALKGWTPTVNVRHVHEVDPATMKQVTRSARLAGGHRDVTEDAE